MKRKEGFTLVEIMIVVAIIGLLALIAIPSLLQAREEAHKKMVQNNLRHIVDARDKVMGDSNVTRLVDVNKGMVDSYVDSEDISLMKWPKGTLIVGGSGSNYDATDTSDANWNDFLTNQYLQAILYDETNTTQKTE